MDLNGLSIALSFDLSAQEKADQADPDSDGSACFIKVSVCVASCEPTPHPAL